MWLLSFAVLLFIIVVGMIIYANWPTMSSGQSCGGCQQSSCSQCPCNRCGMSRKRCGCQMRPQGCPFC